MATQTKAPKASKMKISSIVADVQGKAQAAYVKGTAVAGELGSIAKGNVEAVVASGKVLGAGLKELGDGSVAEGKQAASTFVADLKSFVAVKSPAELFNLQLKLAQRNIDTALALTSKNGKAIGKLAGDVVAPLTSQAKANVSKLRSAA